MINEKELLVNRIFMKLDSFCNGNHEDCRMGYCNFNQECMRVFMPKPEMIKRKKASLKSILRNITSKSNKINGISHPANHGQTLEERIKFCLGCDIYDHPLVAGHQPTINRIKNCTTLNQVVEILDRRSVSVTGKSKLWSYNYRKPEEEKNKREVLGIFPKLK